MCYIQLAACLSVFQCKSSIVSYRIVSYSWAGKRYRPGAAVLLLSIRLQQCGNELPVSLCVFFSLLVHG